MEWNHFLELAEYKIEAECSRVGERIPYIAENGRYQKDMREENLSWWTNGFWSGILWQMYAKTQKPLYKTIAEHTELEFDRALENFEGLHHDVGFMWQLSAVADYRLTGNKTSRRRALHAATLLAGRYNDAGQFIRAWNLDRTGWMIIDCMMNLSLLFWASEETKDPRYQQIACHHADTARRVLMRPNGSCNHIAVFDPETGAVLEKPEGQGYAVGSSWSRGQAWAIYGFALAYFHTGRQEYLDTAKQAAHYFIANVAMTDFVSLVDFRAPQEPVRLDTTAAACAACGLLEIVSAVPELEQPLYQNAAEAILKSLLEKHCDWSCETDGILQHGTAAYHREEDREVPIIYGDYFLIEALMRLTDEGVKFW